MHEVSNWKLYSHGQGWLTKCYSNSIRKAEPRDVNVILMDIDEINNPEQGNAVKMLDAFKEDTYSKYN